MIEIHLDADFRAVASRLASRLYDQFAPTRTAKSDPAPSSPVPPPASAEWERDERISGLSPSLEG